MKRVVKLFDKNTKELILTFEQNEGICDKQLRRKIFFKYHINPDDVIIKLRKVRE